MVLAFHVDVFGNDEASFVSVGSIAPAFGAQVLETVINAGEFCGCGCMTHSTFEVPPPFVM